MKLFLKYNTVTLILFFFLSTSAIAAEYRVQDLIVSDPWSRPLPEVSVNGAAYLTIQNTGTGPDRLIGAVSEIAKQIEIHTHVNQGGLMKMMRLEQGAPIPPGELVAFEPGGLHIMLLGLQSPLKSATQYNLTLQFESAGELDVVVKVNHRGSPGMDHTSDMKHGEAGAAGHSGHMQQSNQAD